MIKEDGTNTRKGAFVNGVTIVKDEQSPLWVVDDGCGHVTIGGLLAPADGLPPYLAMSYTEASCLSDQLRSLVQMDYHPSRQPACVKEC